MHQLNETTDRHPSTRRLGRALAAVLFSAVLGVSGSALAEHGGGGHGGGGHGGGGFHGGGGHGGGFHGGGFRGGFAREDGFHRGFHGRGFHGGFYNGFYPGLGLGLAFGLGYPWGGDYYSAAPAASYYGYSAPYAGVQPWYYCSNPPGYYPYIAQCYTQWQAVPPS